MVPQCLIWTLSNSSAVEVFPSAAADLCINRRYLMFSFGWCARLLLLWPKPCWLLYDAYLQCLSSIKPNGLCSRLIKKYSITPHGDIRYYILSCLTALSIFLCLMAVINFSSASTAIFYSALRPCLTAVINFSSAYTVMRHLTVISIFYSPHGKDQFFFRLLTAISIFYSRHGEDQFFFRLLTAKIDFSFASSRRYPFSIRLTAVLIY